jgi:hypothetical protein
VTAGDEQSRSAANYGIQQYGGVSQVGAQAVGRNARASAGDVTIGAATQPDVLELVRTLRRLVAEHSAELPDPGGASATAEILHDELELSEPDPGVVRRMLDRLAGLVQPVAVVSAAVAQTAEAVRGLLGG